MRAATSLLITSLLFGSLAVGSKITTTSSVNLLSSALDYHLVTAKSNSRQDQLSYRGSGRHRGSGRDRLLEQHKKLIIPA